MNIGTRRAGSLALAGMAYLISSGAGQFPEQYTNLQVLRKQTTHQELESTMRGFAFALNVTCVYCHAAKPNGKPTDFDYASDEKPTKGTARVMMRMVNTINQEYINKVTTTPPISVQCVTCHHGLPLPRTLKSVLSEAIEKQGIDAALELYQALRNKFRNTGQYDFGETTFNELSESLLSQKKIKEAVAVMELNFASNHPDSLWSYHMLAIAHAQNGQIEKAIADYRKALELHPDDDWAKQQILSLSVPR